MTRYSIGGQAAQQLALRRQDALQAQRAALGGQQAVEQVALVLVGKKDVIAKPFELRLKRVDDGNIGVDLAVQQFIEQHGRPACQPGGQMVLFIPSPIDRSTRLIVDRDQIVEAQEHVHLFGFDIHWFLPQGDGVKDQVQIGPVVIDFGQMDIVNGVFDGKRVEMVGLFEDKLVLFRCRLLHVDPQDAVLRTHGIC